MKKISKYILLVLVTLLINLTPSMAKEISLETLGNLVLEQETNASSFYIIGKYVFTDQYVKTNSLNTKDIMLSARSIEVDEGTDGEVKSSPIYDKMNIYTVSKYSDGWKFNDNLIGSPKPQDNELVDIKYIDYNPIKDVYTVTFVDDEDTDISKQEVISGERVTAPNVEAKKGYTLEWHKCDDDNCSSVEDTVFDFNTPITEDIKLKAKWEQNSRVVKFKGMIDDVEDNRFFKDKETVVLSSPNYKLTNDQLPNTEQTGYEFLGWFDEKHPNTEIKVLTDRIFTDEVTTIIGKWKTNVYTITFDSDGGEAIGVKTVKHNETVTTPGEPHKIGVDVYNGYKFLGWFKCTDTTDCENIEEEETAYNFDTPVTENIKLKAKYKSVVYTNKMVNNFVDSINNDDFSAIVEEKDAKILFNVINEETLLSINYDKVKNAIENIKKAKNVIDITIEYNENKTQKITSTSDVDEVLLDLFNDLTGTKYETAKLEDFYQKGFKLTINLADGYKNEEDKTVDVYNVEFIHDFVKVHNQTELKENLNKGKEIIVENWDGTITEPIEINHDVVIDFRNAKIESTITNSKYTFVIKSGNTVSIKDLNLTIDVLLPSEYSRETKKATKIKNTIGIKVEEGASLTVNNIHVNTSETIDKNALTFKDEALNSTSVPINENSAIELHGTLYGSNVLYDAEIYGSPTVLVAKNAQMNLLGLNKTNYIYNIKREDNNTKKSSDTLEKIDEFDHYYKDYNNSYIIIAWYTADSSKIVFAYIYNENLIVPKVFEQNGELYTVNGKTLENWKSRNFENTKTSEELKKEKLTKNETIYLYAMYN